MTGSQQTGRCLCGGVRYRTTGPLREVVNCHCNQCRRQTGHVMAATKVHAADFHLDSEQGLTWYAASETAKRGFCAKCGSTLFWRANGGDHIAIAAGTLDSTSGLITKAHIYCADKGDYYEINDGLPTYPEND